jgi:hypothetical protein
MNRSYNWWCRGEAGAGAATGALISKHYARGESLQPVSWRWLESCFLNTVFSEAINIEELNYIL